MFEALEEALSESMRTIGIEDSDRVSGTGVSSIIGLVSSTDGAKDSSHKWDL